MTELRLIDAVPQAIHHEMTANPLVITMGQDVGVNGGVFRVTDGLYQEFGANRVIDSLLAESGIVGVAIGAAMNDLRPVVEIQLADFIFLAFNQLVSEAARMYYPSNGDYPVPTVVRAPYGGGVHGGLYHSQSVEAFFSHMPGLKVVIPSNPYDAKGLLLSAIRDNNPVLYFEHKRAYNAVKGEVPDEEFTVPIGQAAVLREDQHLSLIAYGLSVYNCLEAAETLNGEGISCEVVDLRTVSPLDTETILRPVTKTGKACIVHEDNLTGGVGGGGGRHPGQRGLRQSGRPVYQVAVPDVPSFPFSPVLENALLPGTAHVIQAGRELASY